jgi:Cu-Zn family superoxide dismutase
MNFKKKRLICVFVTLLGIIVILSGCASLQIGAPKVSKAVAVITPIGDSGVRGVVTFIQEKNAVRIVADLSGLTPGKHGFHIHEFGDRSSPDGMSAGGHFNPHNTAHGDPYDKASHVGDLGNIEADRSGKATYNRLNYKISLTGPNSIIGRSVVIKEKPDDFKTQPGGGAGARIAWGVIGIASQPVE